MNDHESFRALQLMNELEDGESVSQRELAGRLGIAVGLVNSYLKNFVAKGYVRVKNYPRNRYAYLMTPKGLSEKSRLAYQHLSYFTNLYKTARKDSLDLFVALRDQGVNQVVFCGVDEVAEIAFLSLQEVGLELLAVVDFDGVGERFFNRSILPVSAVIDGDPKPIVITSVKKKDILRKGLLQHGVDESNIYMLHNI